jgi:signal peptidase I
VLTAVGLATVFVLVPLWTVVLMRSAAPAYKLPTGGMEQTLLIGDHVIVDATAYGFRLPFQVTPSLMRRPAARGDIAVFRYPPNPSQHFVKRVVGLPGETVEIKGRTVLVDGSALDEPYASFIEALDDPSAEAGWGPEVVPPGHYWMLGDNRDNSKDSRYWGFLPESELIGRVAVVYISIEPSRLQRAGRSDPGRIRWDRFGHVPR